jgi:hypothetical protein
LLKFLIYILIRFDRKNNGFLVEDDFIQGWFQIASEPGREDVLKKLKSFVLEEGIEHATEFGNVSGLVAGTSTIQQAIDNK